jgi:hypothetical protein
MWGFIRRPVKYVNFEDVQQAVIVRAPINCIIINTMPIEEQNCLIRNTVLYDKEENLINDLIKNGNHPKIIIYGRNDTDETVDKKYRQLLGLGFIDVYIYRGGFFEWLLLQDIYGATEFPTTSKMLDLLKFRGTSRFPLRPLL